MAGQAFSQILNPLSLQPGLHLIDGQDVQQIVNQNNSGQGNLTAKAGGGLNGAVPASAYINEFTVVASANDSCVLPPAISGIEVTVINSGAQNLRVYANGANVANAGAADGIVPLAGGATQPYVTIAPAGCGVFSCPVVGRWKSQNV